eukprot:CAMPEP_0197841752 /NCGR_PEP_ID=MMETSP1437-20131217/46356_1 /TAXON_ID=49252 ORGANISM="Eucampia antarctica, Strain CCMP1452" /NCGR_SAMPLE_ID=MMETSP1437 /ASSEMBLY_ACC=CAM_ASM_001096 /LENGTH=170 /DNA_ID=CAMNT_0043451549 /DNA_START=1003 /DNA_END=1515 /DNA_ORIENTATION=-
MISASSLHEGYELEGTVVRVHSYGVFVDVGANRLGLLPIQHVAQLYGRYIRKERGLIEAGLETHARIRVAVSSNQRKRLTLDFTNDVKQQANPKNDTDTDIDNDNDTDDNTITNELDDDQESNGEQDNNDMDEEEDEAAAWAAYAVDEYDDDQDDDEDESIEDSLGLGSY